MSVPFWLYIPNQENTVTRLLPCFSFVTLLVAATAHAAQADDTKSLTLVSDGKADQKVIDTAGWKQKAGWIEGTGANNYLLATVALAPGDFRVDARLRMIGQRGSAAHFLLGDGCFGFEGSGGGIFLSRSLFGGLKRLMPSDEVFSREAWINFTAEREDGRDPIPDQSAPSVCLRVRRRALSPRLLRLTGQHADRSVLDHR